MISGVFGEILVEAETHLGDLQAIERRVGSKARDLGVAGVILLVAETRHNRAVLGLHAEVGERFPIGTRACLGALSTGSDPGVDCLVCL